MVALAKVSKPRHFRVITRDRLYRRVDELTAAGAIWVCGPPGAGKTALLASYLDARKRPVVWMQIDAGDSDPATFFVYLAEAAETYRRKRPALPILAPEYFLDLPAFNRRFFRALFSRLPEGTAVVFDNVQELKAESPVFALLAAAVPEAPQGVALAFISRSEAPEEFVALRATDRLAMLDDAELRLTEDEAQQIGAQRGVRDDALIRAKWQATLGWTAGLVLALESARPVPGAQEKDGNDSNDKAVLFAYFASALLRDASPETRKLLLTTAYVSSFTVAAAQRLSGLANAGEILDRLYRNRMFIERRGVDPPRYQYHALLREFLVQHDAAHGGAERLATMAAAAGMLAEDGATGAAIDLYLQLGSLADAARLILGAAQDTMAQGRWLTLKAWLDLLPTAMVSGEPWLQFWYGACECIMNPIGSRSRIKSAFDGFVGRDELVGQVLSAALATQSFFLDWGSFDGLDGWIPELDRLFDLVPNAGSKDLELRIASSLLVACIYRRLDHPRIREVALRTRSLIEDANDVNLRLSAGIFLLHYPFYLGYNDVSGPRVAAICEQLAERPEATPITRVMFHAPYTYYLGSIGEFATADLHSNRATEIARAHGLGFLESMANWLPRMDATLFSSDIARFKALVAGCEATLLPSRPTDRGWWHQRVGCVHYFEGDLKSAVEQNQHAVSLGRQSGMSLVEIYAWFNLAQIHADRRDFAAGFAAVESAHRAYGGARHPVAIEAVGMCRAYLHFRARAFADCDRELSSALEQARAHGLPHNVFLLHPLLAALLERAIEQGIEEDYARRVIRTRRLRSLSVESEHWPWPVRVRTLGRFALVIADIDLELGSAAQRKTMELLKTLIALGSKNVDIAKLLAILWPGIELIAARRSFDTALHRLRKLAPGIDWLVLDEGRLSLDSSLVWVDLSAFAAVAEHVNSAVASNDAEIVTQSMTRLLRLYRGDFLAGDLEQRWSLQTRDRERARLMEVLGRAGAYFEKTAAWPAAQDLYRRGLAADNLAEPFYRGLIRCLIASNEPAEALRAYRRCRELLSIVLNVQPSAETQSLVRDIG